MDNCFLHLVWYDQDDADPYFIGAFNSRVEAANYVKKIQEDKYSIFKAGLHPANFRITVVQHFSKKMTSSTSIPAASNNL